MENYKLIRKSLKNHVIEAHGCFGCTSLKINDIKGNSYHGRTLEYSTDLPTNIEFYPEGSIFEHKAPDDKTNGLSYKSEYDFLAVSTSLGVEVFDVMNIALEGVNSAGLSGSMNMKTDSRLPKLSEEKYTNSIPWALLLEWALATCGSVEDIKNKINEISCWTEGLPDVVSSFHFIFYDTQKNCAVVEVSNQILHIIDNPTGVLTNGPDFGWHLTNLNNYTHLTNRDINKAKMGGLDLKQPDTGISAALLPSSETSTDRFIRAVFYSSFVQTSDTPEKAIIELSHIMNKFDRPKNMTSADKGFGYMSEYSLWTSLTDIQNKELYIRSYYDLNYQKFTINQFKKENKRASIAIIKQL